MVDATTIGSTADTSVQEATFTLTRGLVRREVLDGTSAAVDRTGGDMLGELFIAGQIEKHHYDAGRNFQQLVAAFMADLGIGGYRSCLDISGGGYDASDGNVSVAQEYERTKRRLGAVRFLYLRTELAKPVGAKCNSVEMLRKALDSLGNY